MIRNLLKRRDGQGMAEYALILALVAVLAIVAVALLGDDVSRTFQRIAEAIR